MLGIIYLLLAGMLGCEASKMLTGEGRSVSGINRIWLMLPASFGVGTLLLTWMVYIISWFFSVVGKAENPLLYGNIIGMTGAAVIMILLSVQKYRKQGSYRIWNIDKTQDKRRLKKEILLFGLLTVFITYMMFYVFYIKDGILYSGLTVYGDYAPHTAMMRSFSAGNNFPTQYPHYGGADVKYHFMFQFLTGNLEYLGMRMDFAYNIVSTLSLVGFLMLLYKLALVGLSGASLSSGCTGYRQQEGGGSGDFSVLFQKRNGFFQICMGAYPGRESCGNPGRKYFLYRIYCQ